MYAEVSVPYAGNWTFAETALRPPLRGIMCYNEDKKGGFRELYCQITYTGMIVTQNQMKWEIMLQHHQNFFREGKTRNIRYRLDALIRLRDHIRAHEPDILKALYRDLHKSEFEAYTTEVGAVLDHIGYVLAHLPLWAKPQKAHTPLVQFGGSSRILWEPYGTVLIVGPFDYPFQLMMEPLIEAVAAGNCAVLKPSSGAPAVAAVMRAIVAESFDEDYVSTVEGDREAVSGLIAQPFDYIFFIGSAAAGRVVMETAARNLTPVTLELGGKSPCIVHRDARIPTACRRIAWGKFLNAGQTCVAPDYLLAHRSLREKLVAGLKETVTEFYGTDPMQSPDYGRIVSVRAVRRLTDILRRDAARIVWGGRCEPQERYIAPTILDDVCPTDACMQAELFGPILPILYYDEFDEAIQFVNDRPKPLALYVFTQSRTVGRQVLRSTSSGGACVNDTINHMRTPYLPFGGVGESGMGAYHGRYGFETFSHAKSVLTKTTRFSAQSVYPPFGDKVRLMRKILK